MKVRALVSSVVLLTAICLVSCGHYTCGTTFGSSTCTPSGTGVSGGGGGGNGAAVCTAYVRGSTPTVRLTVTAPRTRRRELSTATPDTFTAPIVPGQSAGGVGVVVAQGNILYAVFEDLQQIYGWSIDSSGNLTALSGFPVSVSLSNIAALTYNQQVVITNPAGTMLFISEFGNEQILVYQISSSGALTAATGSPFSTRPASLEPQNMAMGWAGPISVRERRGSSGDHSGRVCWWRYSCQVRACSPKLRAAHLIIPIWPDAGRAVAGSYLLGIVAGRRALAGSGQTIRVCMFTT